MSEDGVRLVLHVTYRDTVTGVTGTAQEPWYGSVEGVVYYYSDGNFGCDCNRSNALLDVTEDERFTEDLGCNEGPNRIVIDRIELDGRLLYSDEQRATMIERFRSRP